METENETPYWQTRNKISSKYIKNCLGKPCYICLYKHISLP